ncbi:unnamed protein product [Ambrosiozyma monospora]|uniref:Unnamed protein product n=1 Tax=Ambrosiozyma monospora TaxID=43982 RepID=A0ACB5T2K8_AMBMO|nr:unnamed protein product [Ambrosiozyma monospora]
MKPHRTGLQAKDYRPISLINISSKILEELVLRRMAYFVDQKNILPYNQFGARPGYNAIDPVLQLVHDIKNASGKGSALLMHVQGAYDNVDPKKLVQLMQKLKFPEQMITWVHHFTKNRTTQLITHQHFITSPMKVQMGIPQGSPISSLLFLIYSFPIFTESKISESVTLSDFVDDLNLYATGDNYENNTKALEDAYAAILEEGAKLDMTFDSGDKLQFIHFEDSPHESPKPNFDRHHFNLKPLESVKLLGIHLDKRLNFRTHLEEKLKSFRSVIYLMSELMNGLNTANA